MTASPNISWRSHVNRSIIDSKVIVGLDIILSPTVGDSVNVIRDAFVDITQQRDMKGCVNCGGSINGSETKNNNDLLFNFLRVKEVKPAKIYRKMQIQ